MPRVLYVGNLGPRSPDFATEHDVRRAFEHLGWEVAQVAERDFTAWAAEGGEAWRALCDDCHQADLVLETLTQGSYPHPERVVELWDDLRAAGIPTASIHLDIFYGLSSPKDSGPQRQDLPRLHPMFRVQYVFGADGDHDDLYKRDGVNHYWLPPGVRHDEARDIEPTDEDRRRWGGYDVVFVGAGHGFHPEWNRGALIDALAARYGARFTRVAGDTPWGTTRGEALNRLYSSVPLCVGDSCFADRSSRYTSDRFFETWGRGGFLVHPRLEGIVGLVGEYPSWSPYHDRAAMFAELDRWLADPAGREVERQRMASIIRTGHTYIQRVEQMLTVMGLR